MQKIKQDRSIGGNLKALRKAKGHTQEYMATQLQLRGHAISRMTYSKIERGVYNIRVSELDDIVDLLGCDYNAAFKINYKS